MTFLKSLGFIFLSSGLVFSMSTTFEAAEYYFSRQDFKQAMDIYKSLDDPKSISRLADTKFILQGRKEAREEILVYLNAKNDQIYDEGKFLLKMKLNSILQKFVSDEGQSLYYRALNKIRYRDQASALSLLETSSVLESGNILVLELKANCEKDLKKYDLYLSTLNSIFQLNPYDYKNTERLAETYFYFRDYQKAKEILSTIPKDSRNSYLNFLFSMIAQEMGKSAEDLPLYVDLSPLAFYYLGKNFYKAEIGKPEGLRLFKKFVEQTRSTPAPSWDPLHFSEKVADAKQILEAASAAKRR